MDNAKRVKTIASNTVWFFTSRTVEVVNSFLLIALVARYLGVNDFGVYSFLMATCWTILPLFLVLQRILVRDIAVDRGTAAEIVGGGLTLIALIAPPLLISGMLLLMLFKVETVYFPALAINVFAIAFAALNSVCTSVFIAFEKVKYETMVSFITSTTSMLLIAVAVYFNLGFNSTFAAFMLSNLVGFCVSLLIMSRLGVRPAMKLDFGRMYYFIKECGFLAVNQITIQIYAYLGIFFLKKFATDYDIGIFQAPARVVNRLNVFPISFSVALYPVLASLTAGIYQKEKVDAMITTACRLILIAAIPMSLVGFAMADELVRVFFGAKFSGSVPLFRMMVMGINFTFIICVFDPLLIILHKQRSIFFLNLTLVVLSAALYYPLVKFSGAYGASIALFLSNVVYLVIYLTFISKLVDLSALLQKGWLTLTGGLCAFSFIYFADGDYSKFILLPVALALYFLFIIKSFTFEEMRFMKGVLKKKRLDTQSV
ncbi:MAG: oligosaccharide flippase family protein [Candidatus Magnetominusculus sp. LBB02]|nr:oligosaccharide flippase family protein [Candidatus Magnetominusculus sp. LBB02]